MFCEKCGAKISDTAKFCPECGNNIDTVKMSSDTPKNAEDTNLISSSSEGAPPNAGKLLYTAERPAWAAGGRVAACIIFALLFLAGAIFFMVGAILEPADKGLFIGFVVFDLIIVAVCVIAAVLYSMSAKCYKIEIYSNRIVVRSGFISKNVKQSVMTPIIGVEIEQSFSGRLWNYGYVLIDKVGVGWDIDSHYIKNPVGFKNFLETLIDDKAVEKLQMHIMN